MYRITSRLSWALGAVMLGLSILCGVGSAAPAQDNRRPNILFILLDNVGKD